MIIATDLRDAFTDGQAAFFCARAIEGFARGCVPAAPTWRLPPLYKSGIVYRPEPNLGSGKEDFALPIVTYQRRWGDCDDLCIYRLWELYCCGEDATCQAQWVNDRMHVRVRRANRLFVLEQPFSGTVEDPSIVLGAR